MTQIIRALSEVSAQYDAVFCDLWGCLHNGIALFPDAVEALRGFKARGGQVILVTNAPRPKASVAAQLARMGLPQDAYDDIATSGDAAQFGMLSGEIGQKVYHIGAEKDEPFFTSFDPTLSALATENPITRVEIDAAEGVVCTGLVDDLTETPEDYQGQLRACRDRNLPMLCANPDIVADFGDKRLWCAGALARDYRAMGGEVLYYGKPHAPIYALSKRKLRGVAPRILCIGDGINTDIEGGVTAGLDTLFVTAGLTHGIFGPDEAAPDPDLLTAWLENAQITPTLAIGKLR